MDHATSRRALHANGVEAPSIHSDTRSPDDSATLRDELRLFLKAARDLLRIEVAKGKRAVRDSLFYAAAAAWTFLVMATATICATVWFIAGVVGGVTEWTSRSWIGGLVGGPSVLLAIAIAVTMVRRASARDRLRSLAQSTSVARR